MPYMGYSIRTERYRYARWEHWETKRVAGRELYDHQADPDENHNLADDPAMAATLDSLEARRLAGWRAALPPSAGAGRGRADQGSSDR